MSAPIPRRGRTAPVLALTVVLGLTLTGCDLRLEAPAATEPTASAAEVLRARAVDDALTLQETARTARGTVAGTAPAVAPVLDDVVAFSTRHAAALGGVYSSGLRPSASPSTTRTGTTPPSTPADVLAVLTSSAAGTLGTADTVHDGGMARLLASIGTSRAQLAARLAVALGLPTPAITPTPASAPGPSTGPAALPSPAAPSAPAGPSPSPTVTSARTPGLSPADLDALTVVHDQAGYGLEVVAAKLNAGGRARALAAARAHRAAAEAWAVQAGTAATARDPRRAAYTLPAGLKDAATATAFARTLEQSVADADAAMVASAAPASRGALIADLRSSAEAVVSWGGAPVPLPGFTEATPTTSPSPAASGSPAPSA